MPCGQADRRLKRRRCVYCQREHAKCDGARPCSTCLKRGVKCISYVQPSKFNIVVYRHPSPPRHISPMPMNQPLVDVNTKYISFFFNLVESSASPFIQLFSFASIGELFGSNELVQDTVNLVGKAYVSQGGPSSSFSKSSSQLKHDSRHLLAKLRVKVFKLLKSPVKKPRDFTASLISACLLQFVELLLYDSGSTWSSLVYQLLSTIPPEDVVSGFDDNHDHDHGELLSYLDYRLRLFLRTSGAFWALCFGNDVFWTLAKQTPAPLPPRPDVPLNSMLHNADKHWEALAGSLEECGKLQYQLQSWINELSNPTPKSNGSTEVQGPHSPASHILNGIELVNRASQSQQRIISIIILYSTPTSSLSQDPFCRSLLPYYYWLLTSLSHIFLHPAWRILSVRLPVMTQSLARQQAERAFEYVEDNIQSLKLEAVAYAPILHIIGWQFSADLLERDRVLAVVESLRSSGYSVADRVEKDLQCQWASAEKGD